MLHTLRPIHCAGIPMVPTVRARPRRALSLFCRFFEGLGTLERARSLAVETLFWKLGKVSMMTPEEEWLCVSLIEKRRRARICSSSPGVSERERERERERESLFFDRRISLSLESARSTRLAPCGKKKERLSRLRT